MSTNENNIHLERIKALEEESHHIRVNGIVYNNILRDKALIRDLNLQPTANNVLLYWFERTHKDDKIFNGEILNKKEVINPEHEEMLRKIAE